LILYLAVRRHRQAGNDRAPLLAQAASAVMPEGVYIRCAQNPHQIYRFQLVVLSQATVPQ